MTAYEYSRGGLIPGPTGRKHCAHDWQLSPVTGGFRCADCGRIGFRLLPGEKIIRPDGSVVTVQ